MTRKIAVLAVLLYIAGAVFGQEFTFRGLPWGSTESEIIAKLGVPDSNRNGTFSYYDVEISGYKADLFLKLQEQKFVRANYQIINSADSAYNIYSDLLNKLRLLYGMPVRKTDTVYVYEYYWIVSKTKISHKLRFTDDSNPSRNAVIAIVYEAPEINEYGGL
jgi:hypothetical protein